MLIFAYTVPAIFISLQLDRQSAAAARPGQHHDRRIRDLYLLDKLDQVVTDLGFASTPTECMGSTLNMFVYTMSLMIGTAGLPHVIIRFFTVPKVKDARSSAGWALVFIAILYTTAPAVGAMARLNLMNTIETGEVGTPDGNLVYDERPQWFKNWEKTGLLAVRGQERRRPDPVLQRKNAEFAQGRGLGWKGNEMVKVDRDIMVLANPEIAKLPNWVIALVAAGGLAAALSTAAGLLLAIASAISHDLLKGIFMPNITEKAELTGQSHRDGGARSAWPATWGLIRRALRPARWPWPLVWPPRRSSRR